MEPNYPGPVAHEAVGRHEHNCYAGRVEHGLRADLVLALDEPVGVHTRGLGGDRDEEEVGEDETVEGLDFVLEGRDNSDGRVESVAKEEVDYTLFLRKLQI